MKEKPQGRPFGVEPACCMASRPSSGEVRTGTRSRKASTENMVRLPGGRFLMGADDDKGFPQDGEGAARKVTLDSFWIDVCVVTNSRFQEFVEGTGYKTGVERLGWSFVFCQFLPQGAERFVRGVAGGTPWGLLPVPQAILQPLPSGATQLEHPDSSTVNVGFRCVAS